MLKQENVNCNTRNGIFSSSIVKHTRHKIIKCNVHSDFNKKWLDSSNKRHSSGGTSLVAGSHLIYIRGRPCGMCGENSSTAAGLCQPLLFFLANYHATNILAVIYHHGLVNLVRLRPQPKDIQSRASTNSYKTVWSRLYSEPSNSCLCVML